MDMFRPLIGFVAGLAVTMGLYVAGFLESIPHWSRDHTHWTGSTNSTDPDQAHYRISAMFEPSDDADDEDGGTCPPRFEFHNHTTRNMAFSADGYDDPGYGGGSNYGSQSGQGYVSMTPDQSNGGSSSKNGGGSQSYGQQTHGQQNYDQQSYDQSGYGGQNYDAQGSGSGGYSDAGARYDPNDDEYPGSYGAGCSPGLVTVYLDRNK